MPELKFNIGDKVVLDSDLRLSLNWVYGHKVQIYTVNEVHRYGQFTWGENSLKDSYPRVGYQDGQTNVFPNGHNPIYHVEKDKDKIQGILALDNHKEELKLNEDRDRKIDLAHSMIANASEEYASKSKRLDDLYTNILEKLGYE